MAFLASHRAAGHISGECISVDGGMEGRIIWKEKEVVITQGNPSKPTPSPAVSQKEPAIPAAMSSPTQRRVRVALSVDFDSISGLLGTGKDEANNKADYSQGFFAGNIGVYRLLQLFKKHNVSDKMTWFIPGHSMETFPAATKAIVDSGCEIGLHGYSHEVEWPDSKFSIVTDRHLIGSIPDDRGARERRPREVYPTRYTVDREGTGGVPSSTVSDSGVDHQALDGAWLHLRYVYNSSDTSCTDCGPYFFAFSATLFMS